MNDSALKEMDAAEASGEPRRAAMLRAVETSAMVTSGKERRMRHLCSSW
jgi:hypothetical protein